MAFTPITKKETIEGIEFEAQFNGATATATGQRLQQENPVEFMNYLFKHVIVSPKIDDVDEFFGTNLKLLNKVIEFGVLVMNADPSYFPPAEKDGVKKASK